MNIPSNYIDFLYWFKEETEKSWSDKTRVTHEPHLFGAKWLGLDEAYIPEIEQKYSISFTDEHKAFLKILHAINKQVPRNYFDENKNLIIF